MLVLDSARAGSDIVVVLKSWASICGELLEAGGGRRYDPAT